MVSFSCTVQDHLKVVGDFLNIFYVFIFCLLIITKIVDGYYLHYALDTSGVG